MRHINDNELIRLLKSGANQDDLRLKFDLSQKQLDQVFEKLIAGGHVAYEEVHGIPCLDGLKGAKIRDVLWGHIREKDFEGARKIAAYVREHFPDLMGFKTVLSNLEDAIEYDWREKVYKEFMDKYETPTLFDFKRKYPGSNLHPEIVRQVKHLETCKYTTELASEPFLEYASIGRAEERLARLTPYLYILGDLSDLQAARLWHLIGLKIFVERKVRAFLIQMYDEHLNCNQDGPCAWIHCQTFPIAVGKRIVDKLLSQIETAKIHTPTIWTVRNTPPEQAKKDLIRNARFLPPFCEGCTCQIFAYPIAD
jgi:hypothetical protein